MAPTDRQRRASEAAEARGDEREIIRENVTWSRAASRKLREIAAHRFPGRQRMAGVTLEQIVNEEYERMINERKRA